MTASGMRAKVMVLLVLYLSAMTTPVQAAATITLLDLKSTCISATAGNQASCRSYIAGVVAAYWATVATLRQHGILLDLFCTPSSGGPDSTASVAYVRQYINRHPEAEPIDAAPVIFAALREAYGCRS